MGFVGSSMVIDCHIEVGYCHTGGMPMSVHMFCLSSRRACARSHADGQAEFRTDPMWFTDYMRRETVEWERRGPRRRSKMPDLKTVHLTLPASTADLRQLEIGSVAYLSGRVFTGARRRLQARDGGRAGMPAGKDALGTASFHCSPAAVSRRTAAIRSARSPPPPRSVSPNGSTAASRFPAATSSTSRSASRTSRPPRTSSRPRSRPCARARPTTCPRLASRRCARPWRPSSSAPAGCG